MKPVLFCTYFILCTLHPVVTAHWNYDMEFKHIIYFTRNQLILKSVHKDFSCLLHTCVGHIYCLRIDNSKCRKKQFGVKCGPWFELLQQYSSTSPKMTCLHIVFIVWGDNFKLHTGKAKVMDHDIK